METLTKAQKKHLRGLAHPLEPIVRLGRAGLSEGALAELDGALAAHELVKVRFPALREEKDAASLVIEERLRAQVVSRVGHVFVLFRQNRDPEKRKIRLPR